MTTIQWFRNGVELTNQTTLVLEIMNVMASEGGDYNCTVDGVASDVVTVYILPQFTSQPSQISSDSTTTLTCTASGFPDPVYMWGRVDEMDIRSDIMTNLSTLVFDPLMFGDEGDYFCNATSGGVTIQSQAVTVNGMAHLIADEPWYYTCVACSCTSGHSSS